MFYYIKHILSLLHLHQIIDTWIHCRKPVPGPTILTVCRPDTHILEGDKTGGLDDNLDRLRPLHRAYVSLAFLVFVADSGLKCEVRGSRDVDAGLTVVENLRREKLLFNP